MFGNLFGKRTPSLYRTIKPRSSEALGAWASHFQTYTEIVGYSSLGHVFLRDASNRDYAVLHPSKGAAKSYGKHETVSDFEKSVLLEPGFESFVLRPAHVKAIASRVGPLKGDEIYIPAPYAFLGGTEAPETYEKGDFWASMHIVAQLRGL